MRNEQHYRRMLEQNPSASVGFTLAASMVYAARYGICEAEHRGTDEWREIARRLKADYGENLDVDQVSAEMDTANRSAAAAKLGSLGGSRNTPAQNAARAANAKRAGRPKGSKNKPKLDAIDLPPKPPTDPRVEKLEQEYTDRRNKTAGAGALKGKP